MLKLTLSAAAAAIALMAGTLANDGAQAQETYWGTDGNFYQWDGAQYVVAGYWATDGYFYGWDGAQWFATAYLGTDGCLYQWNGSQYVATSCPGAGQPEQVGVPCLLENGCIDLTPRPGDLAPLEAGPDARSPGINDPWLYGPPHNPYHH